MAERAAAPLRELLVEKGRALFSGRIDVEVGALLGTIHLAEGQIVDARVGSVVGEPALWRMLLARTPRVGVEAGKPRATEGAVLGKPEPLIERFEDREELLVRYAEKVGGFGAVWAIRFDVLASRLDELPDAINPLIRLLDGRRSVRQVIVEAALDELLALRILARLLALGALEVPASVVVGRLEEDRVGDNRERAVDGSGGLEGALLASLDDPSHDPIPLDTRKPAPEQPPPVQQPNAAPSRAETSSPPGMMPPPDAAIISSLPRAAPPLEKNDELRVWLGNEEAFFVAPSNPAALSGPPAKASRVVPPALLAVLMLLAALVGALIATRC
jgi:hypothetical protein